MPARPRASLRARGQRASPRLAAWRRALRRARPAAAAAGGVLALGARRGEQRRFPGALDGAHGSRAADLSLLASAVSAAAMRAIQPCRFGHCVIGGGSRAQSTQPLWRVHAQPLRRRGRWGSWAWPWARRLRLSGDVHAGRVQRRL